MLVLRNVSGKVRIFRYTNLFSTERTKIYASSPTVSRLTARKADKAEI